MWAWTGISYEEDRNAKERHGSFLRAADDSERMEPQFALELAFYRPLRARGQMGGGSINSNKGMNVPDVNHPAYPSRKRLNHRGPLSVDVVTAWYFRTICAKDHAPWSMRDDQVGRDDPIAPDTLGLPMGITDYELKKVLPSKAQLAKCVANAERQVAIAQKGTEK